MRLRVRRQAACGCGLRLLLYSSRCAGRMTLTSLSERPRGRRSLQLRPSASSTEGTRCSRTSPTRSPLDLWLALVRGAARGHAAARVLRLARAARDKLAGEGGEERVYVERIDRFLAAKP